MGYNKGLRVRHPLVGSGGKLANAGRRTVISSAAGFDSYQAFLSILALAKALDALELRNNHSIQITGEKPLNDKMVELMP
jgi:hypothetical protein